MIEKISATKLESYVSCPYKFYLRYVKNVAHQHLATDYMLLGTLVHKVLEEFHLFVLSMKLPEDLIGLKFMLMEKGAHLTMNRVRAMDAGHPGILRRLKLAETDIFNNYVKPYITYFIVQGFYTKRLEPEKQLDTTLGEIAASMPHEQLRPSYEHFKNVIVQGKIDLVVYPDLIIDFKTQASPPSMKDLVKSFQTTLYSIIFDKDIQFMFLYLSPKMKNKIIDIKKADRVNRFNMLLEVMEAIEGSNRYAKNPKSCYTCIFRKFCY